MKSQTITPALVAHNLRATGRYNAQQIDAAVSGMNRAGYTIDSEPDPADIAELRQDLAEMKKSNNASVGGLGELRGDHRDLESRVNTLERAIAYLAGADPDDQMSRTTPEANGPNQPPDATSDGLRAWNNKNRKKYGYAHDEILDPSQPSNNQANQASTVAGNSSKTSKSLDLGQTWGTQRLATNDAINRIQRRNRDTYDRGIVQPHIDPDRNPLTVAINKANATLWRRNGGMR